MRKLFVLVVLLLFSASVDAATTYKIHQYTFETDGAYGSFTVNRDTYTIKMDALVGIKYILSATDGVATVYTHGSFKILPRKSLPSATSIKSSIKINATNNGLFLDMQRSLSAAMAERKRSQQTGVVTSVEGTSLVP